MIPTFRPWTHTSDDSYIYQLSLVVATATVSFLFWFLFLSFFSLSLHRLLCLLHYNVPGTISVLVL